MGCASSKRIEADTLDVYRPAPSSFSVFDITAIEEPWLKNAADAEDADNGKPPSNVPAPILDKLKAMDEAPRSWDEVSKALEDMKPELKPAPAPAPDTYAKQAAPLAHNSPAAKVPRKSFSFHTLEELEAKITSKPAELKRAESKPELKRLGSDWTEPTSTQLDSGEHRSGLKKFGSARAEPEAQPTTRPHADVPRSLKENIFIQRDRLERERAGKPESLMKRNPLSDFEEICPPGGADEVVVYTTSLGGVRRTYEDCNMVRQLMETHRVVFDERDVALDGGFLTELRELLGEGATVPRVFVKGRYIGGVEEVVGLNEMGRLSRILNWASVERGVGRLGCGGCGGARFVPCMECGGSCKVVVGDKKERCGECNENGLVHCPTCA